MSLMSFLLELLPLKTRTTAHSGKLWLTVAHEPGRLFEAETEGGEKN